MSDKLFVRAGKTIVETCSRLMPSEHVVIVTDEETKKIGKTVAVQAEKIADNVSVHVLEEYGDRPLSTLPKPIERDVKEGDVTYFAAQSKEGELPQFRRPLIELATEYGREIHMPNIDETIVKTGLQADYYTIASLTYRIAGMAVRAKTVRVTTPAGTDITATFSPNLKWVPDTGLLWYRGMFGNLPAGEVFTCPKSVEGTMIVDGILGDFFNEKYGTLGDTPLTIPLHKGRAKVEDITCENDQLLNEFQQYLTEDEHANRVGEFACGTNTALDSLVSNLLQDEKFPGIHLAFGYPYPKKTGANWESGGHVDGILKDCSVWFDDVQIMEDGAFIIEEGF